MVLQLALWEIPTLASMGFVVSPKAKKEPLAKYLLWYANVGIPHRAML